MDNKIKEAAPFIAAAFFVIGLFFFYMKIKTDKQHAAAFKVEASSTTTYATQAMQKRCTSLHR